ncbi:hypothetical protein [Actinomadura nitritigenes]|uniref:hypothetical protein n=1 Tax=Actinomadura nitritigenes TaxID=134602 RepID=UPI003D94916F
MIDCVEALMAAVTWIYRQIKILIDDILRFLEYLFGWQDILVTHEVLKNVFRWLAQSAIDGLAATKAEVGALTGELQGEIDSWADIPDFPQTQSSTLASSGAGQASAPGNLGVHHFQNGVGASSSALSPDGPAEGVLDDLINLMEAEYGTLSAAADAFKTDIIDQFSTLTVTQVIERFAAIVGDTVLQSAENVLDTVLDALGQLVTGVMDVLTADLDIPVLSWLYNDLTGDDLSFLDLVCLIAAIPVTIGYKLSSKTAPFSADDPFAQGLIAAQSWSQIQEQFLVTPAPRGAAAAPDDTPVLDQAKLNLFAYVTGYAATVGGLILIITTNIQRDCGLKGTTDGAKMPACIGSVANVAYVSPNLGAMVDFADNTWDVRLNDALTGISIVKGFAGIPAAFTTRKECSEAFGFTETFINTLWNVPVIANIIANKNAWNTTDKPLVPASIGNFAFNLGGIMELPIVVTVNAGQEEATIALAVVQGVLMTSYGICMIVAGALAEFAD